MSSAIASSSKSRRDDYSSRHNRDESKRSGARKDSDKSREAKRDSRKGTSSRGSSPKTSEKGNSPKDISDVQKKEKVSKEKDEEAERKKEQRLEQLRKERAEKIEREHQLREERKKKERERERQLREERRREQEKREKERRERARKEAERVRKDREKQRELERQREREREKERERFIRERKEREERERREREKEREQLERERLERERLERERREQERLEKERIERERQERERLEKERLAREEHESRIERERQRLEQQRLERERAERERERERRVIDRGIDRGLGSNTLKRTAPSNDRGYHNETKKNFNEQSASRKGFFSAGNANREGKVPSHYIQDDVYDVAYQRRNNTPKSDHRGGRDLRDDSRRDVRSGDVRKDERVDSRDIRRNSRDEYDAVEKTRDAISSDIRRVVQRNDVERGSYSRDRSPHRVSESNQRYRSGAEERVYTARDFDRRGGDSNWLSAPNSNAPKTLSDVLGRAGLTGILGNQAESSQPYSQRRDYSPKESSDRYYSPDMRRPLDRNNEPESNDRGVRLSDRNIGPDRRSGDRDMIREDRRPDARESRGDFRITRDSRDLRESRDVRGEQRERRDDRVIRNSNRGGEARDFRGDVRGDVRRDDRGESYRDEDNFRNARRDGHFNEDRKDIRDSERREVRENTRHSRDYPSNQSAAVERGIKPTIQPNDPLSMTERRGLHPLAADITSRALTTVVSQPRVVPLTDLFGRPLQPVVANPAAHALQAGYAQGLALHQVAQTGIQLGRDGRLEYTRVGQPQTGIPPVQRRY